MDSTHQKLEGRYLTFCYSVSRTLQTLNQKALTQKSDHSSEGQGSTMKLSFRGVTYEHNFPDIEITGTQESLTFLGRRYTQKLTKMSRHRKSSSEMTYRGVRYIH
jgi:hypothetical protein